MKSILPGANRSVRYFFWAMAILLGFLQAWASRLDLPSDTVTYLDMGDQFWSGHRSMAVNGIWNPLYAVILGLGDRLFRPSLYWEYPLVHCIAFLIFLIALWSFDFFLQELIRLRQESQSGGELQIPTWVWQTLGYTLFLWGSLHLIVVSETNPDMLVAACFFLACGLLVKIRRGIAGWTTYLGLGLALGLGYLTKAIMFPVSIVCLAAAFGCSVRQQQLRRACGALVVFLAVSVPFVAALSKSKHKITYSETGRYNYATYVNKINAVHWQGDIPGSGTPLHGTRQIFDRPATFEFGNPFEVTYPVWYDQSYWTDGLKVHFNIRNQVKIFVGLLTAEALMFLYLHGSIVAGLFVIFYVSGRKWWVLNDIAEYWFLLLPAVGALGIYALVHLEPRYLAPFMVVTILCLFFSVRLPASRDNRRLISAVAVLVFAMFLCPLGTSSLHIRGAIGDILGRSKVDPNSHQEVAEEMYQMGLRPGDRIASLEYSCFNAAQWARLARVRIVAEVSYWPQNLFDLSANNFWEADPKTQKKVIQALAKTGARVAVSQLAPPTAVASGWQRVGSTQYYLYWLNQASAVSSGN